MKRFLTGLLSATLLLAIGMPAYAFIQAPSSVTISDVMIFRNLAEDGDLLVMFHYSMPYASDNYSDTPASKSVIFRFVDTDNITELQTGKPYVNSFFGSNGYGEGTGSFYFSDNASMWEKAFSLEIVLPTGFFGDSANVTRKTLTTSDYITQTTQEANRDTLKEYILLECDELAADYSDTGIVMKADSDAGIVLSSYGSLYFRGAVPGLQTLCPDLFFIQSLIPEQMTVQTYNMSMQTTYTNRLVGGDLGEGFENMAALLNMGTGAFGGLLGFLLTVGLAIWTQRRDWGIEPGLIMGAVGCVGLAILVGDVVFSVVMVGSLVAGIGIVWLFLLKRAS